jgi:hypothetical protein
MEFKAVEGAGEPGRELARAPSTLPMTSDGFIGMVLSQPDSAEKVQLLRELIQMQNAERERICKENFDMHFAELRKDLQHVTKNKINTGLKTPYASLDWLQDQCDATIFQHGFSYSWDEEALEEGRKCIIMNIYGYGHTKPIRWEAPAYSGNKGTNALQDAGIQSTYGERYTYKSGFGIVIKGEDTDGGNAFEIDADLRATLDKLEGAETVDKLLEFNKIALERYSDNANAKTFILGTYAQARKRLTGGPQ